MVLVQLLKWELGPLILGSDVITWTGVSLFSDFTGNGNGSPLPISLIEFNAIKVVDAVQLTWITASELNNDYFTIERSLDGYSFEAIHQEPGAGNSNQWLNYEWYDHSPFDGINYYRLKQTDFDGSFTYSTLRMVDFSKTNSGNNAWVNMYPNPSMDGNLYLSFGDLDDGGNCFNEHVGTKFTS